MKKIQPTLVSILLPTFNVSGSLRSCLDSLLSQTYAPIEIIAIDDFSKDDSYKILKEYHAKDKRVHVSRNVKRYGLAVTLNRALKDARGQYITFMNATDIATTSRIQRQVNYLSENPKNVAVGTQCQFVDKDMKKVAKSDFPLDHETITKTLLTGVSLQYESVLINRYLLPKDLLHFSDKKYPFIYADLFVQLMQYGAFSNLKHNLYFRMQQEHKHLHTLKQRMVPQVSLWLKARFMYDNKLPVSSLITPLAKNL